jgi:uncharacterized protein (DUF1778 family)
MATAIIHHAPRRKKAAATAKETRQALNIRIKPVDRSLIDHAADLTGKNLTDFVIDAAREAAQHALLDRSVIPVSEAAYAEFVSLLDAPPKPNERLRRALQTPAPWEK